MKRYKLEMRQNKSTKGKDKIEKWKDCCHDVSLTYCEPLDEWIFKSNSQENLQPRSKHNKDLIHEIKFEKMGYNGRILGEEREEKTRKGRLKDSELND